MCFLVTVVVIVGKGDRELWFRCFGVSVVLEDSSVGVEEFETREF